jgi:hypothetical protein
MITTAGGRGLAGVFRPSFLRNHTWASINVSIGLPTLALLCHAPMILPRPPTW